jgi:hypothetical protein
MKKQNFDKSIEIIKKAVSELLPIKDSRNNEIREIINYLLDCAENGYCLIPFPNSQEYMEEEWFDKEAILALGIEYKIGGSAYFIPIKRIINSINSK